MSDLSSRERVPPRVLPLAYFLFAHLSLILACLIPTIHPDAMLFFLSARFVGAVHFVTLGWITLTIFGALYLVAPLALRTTMRARAVDWWILAITLTGASGIVSHFWIDEFHGMAWSGLTLLLAVAMLFGRLFGPLVRSPAPLAVRLHIAFAFLNLLAAGVLGTVLATRHKSRGLNDVFAHAHLALGGWTLMLTIGVAYRLLPMFLPARPPGRVTPWVSLVAIQVSVFDLAAALWFGERTPHVAALGLTVGVGAFLSAVARMLVRRLPAPKKLIRPDVGMLHAIQALLYLTASAAMGLVLVFSDTLDLQLVSYYGAAVLLGFLAQIVLGVGMRLIPMFVWLRAWVQSGYKERPPSPHVMPVRALLWIAFAGWTVGVPVLAHGLANTNEATIRAGGAMLLTTAVAAFVNAIVVARHALRGRPHTR